MIWNRILKRSRRRAAALAGRGQSLEARALLAAPSIAIPETASIPGEFPSDSTPLGDVSGDGVSDFAVGARGNDGSVRIFSGADLSELSVRNGPPGNSDLGVRLARLGDITGDGIEDLAAVNGRRGSVTLMSGVNLSVIRVHGEDAYSVGSFADDGVGGDIDGDGVPDYAVASRENDRVDFRSGATGDLIDRHPLVRPGTAVHSVGDINGDGLNDVGVSGAPGRILSGADGSVLQTVGPFAQHLIDAVGDFDGDGTGDYVFAGADADYVVRDGNDGSLLAVLEDDPGTPYDHNEDGVDDFVEERFSSVVRVFSGADNSQLSATVVDDFGTTYIFHPLGDIDGDGVMEISAESRFQGVSEEFNFIGIVDLAGGDAGFFVNAQTTDRARRPMPAGPLAEDGSDVWFAYARSSEIASDFFGVAYGGGGPAYVFPTAPLGLGPAVRYDHGTDSAVRIAAGVEVADDGQIVSAVFDFGSTFVAGEDTLQVVGLPAGIMSDFDADTGVLTLSGSASPENYDEAVSKVRYRNRDFDDPTGGVRTVSITITDDEGLTDSTSVDIETTVPGPMPMEGLSVFTDDNRWLFARNVDGESFQDAVELEQWPGGFTYDKAVILNRGVIARNPTNGFVFGSRITDAETGEVSGRRYLFTMDPNDEWSDLYAGDFDGSGRTQLMARNHTTGRWHHYLIGFAGGAFALSNPNSTDAGFWSTNVDWEVLGVGDFSGDGQDQILGRVVGGSGYYVGGLNENGTIQTTRWAALDRRFTWEQPTIGDFDGDGRDDLLAVKGDTRSLYLGRSTGSAFAVANAGGIARTGEWSEIVVGDFNGGGGDEIALRRLENATSTPPRANWFVGTFRTGNSKFGFTVWDSWTNTRPWVDVLAEDFNGDGLDDIVGRLDDNDRLYVAESDGSSFDTNLWGLFDDADGESLAAGTTDV